MARRVSDQDAVGKLGGHFKLTSLLEKRYRELLFGSRPMVETESRDIMDTLLREVMEEKIDLVPEAEAVAAAARALLGDEKEEEVIGSSEGEKADEAAPEDEGEQDEE